MVQARAPDFLLPHNSGPAAVIPILGSGNFILLIAQFKISWSHAGVLFATFKKIFLISYLISENSVGYTFKIYVDFSHFSPPLIIITLNLFTLTLS